MKTITVPIMKKWFKTQGHEPRHNLKAMKHSINKLNNEVNTDAYSLFLLLVSNEPIKEMHTHSYGFHTRNGRYLIDSMKYYYNDFKQINKH